LWPLDDDFDEDLALVLPLILDLEEDELLWMGLLGITGELRYTTDISDPDANELLIGTIPGDFNGTLTELGVPADAEITGFEFAWLEGLLGIIGWLFVEGDGVPALIAMDLFKEGLLLELGLEIGTVNVAPEWKLGLDIIGGRIGIWHSSGPPGAPSDNLTVAVLVFALFKDFAASFAAEDSEGSWTLIVVPYLRLSATFPSYWFLIEIQLFHRRSRFPRNSFL